MKTDDIPSESEEKLVFSMTVIVVHRMNNIYFVQVLYKLVFTQKKQRFVGLTVKTYYFITNSVSVVSKNGIVSFFTYRYED